MPAAINPGQIVTRRGTYGGTTTDMADLQSAAAVKPFVRDMLEVKNKRYFTTLFSSGAIGPWGVKNDAKTKIPLVDGKRKIFGSDAYQFDCIGRLDKAASIRSQQGSSGSDGSFSLVMQDDYLYPGAVVRFYSGKQARVQSLQSGNAASGFVYSLKTMDGSTFTYSTDVASVTSCFILYTAYPDGSLRGYSRDKKPDRIIQHSTILRQTVEITGGADATTLEYQWANGQKIGWMYWKVDEMKAILSKHNEYLNWLGVSTMKASDGTLRAESHMIDPETSRGVVSGDGFVEQIAGTNTAIGSGVNGLATADDFSDMFRRIEQSSNMVDGLTFIIVTGGLGYSNAQTVLPTLAGNQNATFFQNVTQSSDPGGARVDVGYNFSRFNIAGNSAMLFKNPLQDDTSAFPGANGESSFAGSYFIIGIDSNDPSMEILAKSANGVDRSYVEASYVGLTGKSGMVTSEADYNKVACLMETLFVVHRPELCGIIWQS